MSNTSPALLTPLEDFARAESRVAAFVDSVPAERLSWSPVSQRWSALQCVDHLVSTNNALADAIEAALDNSAATDNTDASIRKSWLWRLFLAITEPPVWLKAPAPGVLKPQSNPDPERTRQELVRTHDRLRALAARAASHDVNRVRFRHPFIPLKISLGECFLLVAAHERRHLWQAEQVLAG